MEIERNELCNIIEQHKIKIVNYFGTEELSEILKLNYSETPLKFYKTAVIRKSVPEQYILEKLFRK